MRTVVGVMGSGAVLSADAEETARRLGRLIAEQGWVLLTGGRACGVMDAASRGAHEAGGWVLGVLPDAGGDDASEFLDVRIRSGMGHGRNLLNALSSDVVIALPGKAGTLSEVCFALIAGRTVVLVGWDAGPALAEYADRGQLLRVETAEEAVAAARRALEQVGG